MPLYEYVCDDCKRRTEVLQALREKPLRICPHCGGRLKKAISAAAIQFKGSGWYVTDYARPKREKKTEKAGESETAGRASETQKEKPAEPKKESKKSS